MEIPMAHFLAKNGYVTAIVEYRLSPEALYPAEVYDLKTAVRWIRANAKKYNIDENKIAVYGCSSGGQLTALFGTTNGIQKLEGTGGYKNYSSDVKAVVDIDGVLDMTDLNESGKDTDPRKPSAAKQLLGVLYKDNPESWEEASAVSHVNKKSVPILFINSSLPRFHSGRDEMIEKLDMLNIYSDVYTIPNTLHQFWLFHSWFDETANSILKFLDKIFKEK